MSLSLIGHDFVQSFVAVSCETFGIAIYSAMVFKAVKILYAKKKTYTVTIQLGAVVVLFILALIEWIIDCVNTVGEARITLIDDPDGDLESKYNDALEFIFRRNAIQAMIYAYMTVIGDAIIIWRVHAFWSMERLRLLVLLPASMLLGSFIVTIMLTYCVGHLGSEIILGTFQKPAFCRNIQTASYTTAVATTLFATILIGIKARRYHLANKLLFSKRQKRTQLEKVMVILVESGVLYLIFFVAQMLISISSINVAIEDKPNAVFALTIFDDTSSVIVGLYPTIVIILVHSDHAIIETSGIGTTSLNTKKRSLNVSFSRMVVNDSQPSKSDIQLQDFDAHLDPSIPDPILQKAPEPINLSV